MGHNNNNNLPYLTIITLLLSHHLPSQIPSTSFKITNKCQHTVWPAILSGANTPQLHTTGFSLKSRHSKTINLPPLWSGRLWARTFCSFDPSGRFSCLTGDCGSGQVPCAGAGAVPPATLAEFTINGSDGLDFYDVSVVDGYNLPILVLPKGRSENRSGNGGCSATGCLVDMNGVCPIDLTVYSEGGGGRRVGCRSACEVFGDPQYCCSGEYSTPDVCMPSVYSKFFKSVCPRAYSYAYDDKTSTFTCPSASSDYLIVFCPPPFTSQKLVGLHHKSTELALVSPSTIYIARHHSSGMPSPPLVNSSASVLLLTVIITIMFL